MAQTASQSRSAASIPESKPTAAGILLMLVYLVLAAMVSVAIVVMVSHEAAATISGISPAIPTIVQLPPFW